MSTWYDEILTELHLSEEMIHWTDEHICSINDKQIEFVYTGEKSHHDDAIIIHEDLFHNRKPQLISRLDSLLGLDEGRIHGRDTSARYIDKETARQFLDTYHLMGFGGGKFFVGLFDEVELVAVAVFSKILFMKYEDPPYNSVELERFCSMKGEHVVGGLDKVIKFFISEKEVDDIITYIDKEWSDGSSYIGLGFQKIGETDPITFYLDEQNIRHRQPVEGGIEISNKGNLKLRLKL